MAASNTRTHLDAAVEGIDELQDIIRHYRAGLYTPDDLKMALLYASANLRNKLMADDRQRDADRRLMRAVHHA